MHCTLLSESDAFGADLWKKSLSSCAAFANIPESKPRDAA
jgi:hypothetical protein